MKQLIFVTTFILFVPTSVLSLAEDKEKPTEMDGRWKEVKLIIDGKEFPAQHINTIKGETHTITTLGGNLMAIQRAKLDPSKNPKTIDLEFTKGAPPGKKYWRGIYAVNGDELKLCVKQGKDWLDEKERPTEFVSKPGSGVALVVFRRVEGDYQVQGPAPTVADMVYGRKDGLALTLDVYRPKERANGAAAMWVLSSGFVTQTTAEPDFVAFHDEQLKRGYTVIAVRPGSQPRYTVPEITDDVHRAVRFIRHKAADWKLDGDRIGISGTSAGGYLALFVGVTGDKGKSEDIDPVERLPSRVGAVASFCPPTDFLSIGITLEILPVDLRGAFDFHRFDETKGVFIPVRERSEYRGIVERLSPARRVTKDAAPTLILHGDKDEAVPLRHAELMVAKLKEVGVSCQLVVKKGSGHVWKDDKDARMVADWFDQHLAKRKTENR